METTADMEKYWKEEQDEQALDPTALKCRPPRTTPPPPLLPHPNSPSSSSSEAVQDDEQEQQPQAAEKSERSIYFETQDGVTVGTEATDGFGGMKYGAAGHSVAENKLGNGESDLRLNGVDFPNSLTTETDYGIKHNLNGEGRSSLPPTYPENGSASRKPVEDPHLRVLDESEQVVAEWDVETVIAEQETHDLFCPNCKSCITKRVILKKRKRKETLQNGSKRVVQFPSLDQGHDTAPLVVDGSPSVDPADQDRETEPVLFRCFSCFSFFIPSVACFKSLFGDRGDRESARTGAFIEEKKTTTVSALSPTTFPQPGYSHVDEHFSTTEIWNDQHGHVSSKTVSVHRESTQTNNDDKQMNSSMRTDGGFDAMQDLSTGELSKPLALSDINLTTENSGSLNSPASQLPRISDRNLDENMSKRFGALLPQDKYDTGKDLEGPSRGTDAGNEVRVIIEEERVSSIVSENSENNINSSRADTSTYKLTEYRGEQQVDEDKSPIKWDILKSVVYGGLVESITSLGVVSSAAGGGAATLNIIAIGLASLVGGLFMIAHGLVDLKNEQYGRDTTQYRSVDRYQELLGNRRVFKLHVTLAILSYLLFGLVAPVTYCFSFQESDNRNYKLIAVAVASLVCIAILAFSKVYAQQPPKAYFTTVMYYVSMGVMSSGLSYVVGVLIKKLLEDLGWFEPTVVPTPPTVFLEKMAAGYLSSSY